MNAKIRMIGLLFAVVVVVAAIGLSESRGQDATVDVTKGRNAVAQDISDVSLPGQRADRDVLVDPPSAAAGDLPGSRKRADRLPGAGSFGPKIFGKVRIQPITQQIKNHRHSLSSTVPTLLTRLKCFCN